MDALDRAERELGRITGDERQAALEQIAALEAEAAVAAVSAARQTIARMREALDATAHSLALAEAGELPTWNEPPGELAVDLEPIREAFAALGKADRSQQQLGLAEGAPGAAVLFRIEDRSGRDDWALEQEAPVPPAKELCPRCGAPTSSNELEVYCAELCGWSRGRGKVALRPRPGGGR